MSNFTHNPPDTQGSVTCLGAMLVLRVFSVGAARTGKPWGVSGQWGVKWRGFTGAVGGAFPCMRAAAPNVGMTPPHPSAAAGTRTACGHRAHTFAS